MLLFSSISSYVVETRLRGLAEQAQFLAQTTAIELVAIAGARRFGRSARAQAGDARRRAFPKRRWRSCPSRARAHRTHRVSCPRRRCREPIAAGPWPHLDAPTSVPSLGGVHRVLGADGVLGAPSGAPTAGRHETDTAVASDAPRRPPRQGPRAQPARAPCGSSCGRWHSRPGRRPRYAVVLDLPLNELTILRLREETGISLRGISLMKGTGALPMTGRQSAPDAHAVGRRRQDERRFSRRGSCSSSSPIGRPDVRGTATVSIMLNMAEIYSRLSPSRFGQLLVLVIFVVGVAVPDHRSSSRCRWASRSRDRSPARSTSCSSAPSACGRATSRTGSP